MAIYFLSISFFFNVVLFFFRFKVRFPDLRVANGITIDAPPTGWLHLVVNFDGTEDEAVFTMYLNGVKSGRAHHSFSSQDFSEGSGEVVVGMLRPV